MAAWGGGGGRDFCSGWETRAEPRLFLRSKEEVVGKPAPLLGVGTGRVIVCLRVAGNGGKKTIHSNL